MDTASIRRFVCVFLAVCFKTYVAFEPYRSNHHRATNFDTVIPGYALKNHVIKTVHESVLLDCGFSCLSTPNCQSYNGRQENKDLYECELSSSTKSQHPSDFKATQGVTYYGSDAFPGLGCAAVDCPNQNCQETKTYPFYHCPDGGFDLNFPASPNHIVTGIYSVIFNELSICFWCKTSQVSLTFVSYENKGSPPSILNLIYGDSHVTLMINSKTATDASFPIPPIHDNTWHHVCTTWNSTSGHVKVFVDGAQRTYPGKSYFQGEKLVGNGAFTIGYSKFGANESNYTGKISQLNIWDHVLPSDEIKSMAKNCTSTMGGNIVKWGQDLTPRESDLAEPRLCGEREVKSDYDLHFSTEDNEYVKVSNLPSLTKLTISCWLKTAWIPTDKNVEENVVKTISALYHGPYETITFALRGNLQMLFTLMGEKSWRKVPPINDDRWHHVAITWDNTDGKSALYVDGVERSTVDNFQTDKVIAKEGELRIWQTLDFHGILSRYNIWDTILEVETIVALAMYPGNDRGNVVSWSGIRKLLSNKLKANEPSTVVSSVGKSNVALTFSQTSKEHYAILPYNGAEISQLTVCTWIDFTYPLENKKAALVSYATPPQTNEFYLIFHISKIRIVVRNKPYVVGPYAELKDKKWRHFCVTWDGVKGEGKLYVEGSNISSITTLPKNEVLRSPGKWVFNNEQDSYGGGFSDSQSVMTSLAQTNVWNYVLPVPAMEALSFGGTSVEGNLLRWSDMVANYNENAYTTISSFTLYWPDGVVQKKRDAFCNRLSACQVSPGSPRYARVGPRDDSDVMPFDGMKWRCYCLENLANGRNVRVTSTDYITRSELATIF